MWFFVHVLDQLIHVSIYNVYFIYSTASSSICIEHISVCLSNRPSVCPFVYNFPQKWCRLINRCISKFWCDKLFGAFFPQGCNGHLTFHIKIWEKLLKVCVNLQLQRNWQTFWHYLEYDVGDIWGLWSGYWEMNLRSSKGKTCQI